MEDRVVGYRLKGHKVFQHFNLFPHMTVLENVMEAPLRVLKQRKDDVRRRALGLLEEVGLAEKAQAYPRHLSGGQQQLSIRSTNGRAPFCPRCSSP